MPSRRSFLHQLTRAAGTGAFLSLTNAALAADARRQQERFAQLPDEAALQDETFWGWVQQQFTVSPNLLNLNNGGVSPQPKPVQEAHIRFYQYSNEAPSYYMWRILDEGREALRSKLAGLAGCDPEELAINRNATEGLNTVIFGLNLKAGDEVVLSKQDYPNMIHAWKQREKRDGIRLVWLDLQLPEENPEVLVQQYVKAFTSRTKVVHVTHLINWTGQVLPIRRIADVAHQRGIEVIGDGAHSFAHFDFRIPDLGCDYFATSLHKWLCAPFGSGLLWIRKEKIKNIWALLSSGQPDGPDIRKFESLGTRSFASEMAIGNALDFHQVIGSKRKEERLRYLTGYWTSRVAHLKGVRFLQPRTPSFYGAIANIAMEGIKPADLASTLHNTYKIHTVAIDRENIHGVRITPHVYTQPADLDRLVLALNKIAGSGMGSR
ncbi:MAG TPA: aminotransferase class V-fold PLP-dependent enzyme [Lacibacter sp.]|nr:aminotransferase class V-fold PLP-dependent enzyme [Lacibacter sp.]HMO88995.1 aminotransferase class V-fold PLP-dependent enzyme [Lacibacter sp.]HMP88385.1 aminotransferase class V-fold PLP-dependent enzyme [Lacibacter sp.]